MFSPELFPLQDREFGYFMAVHEHVPIIPLHSRSPECGNFWIAAVLSLPCFACWHFCLLCLCLTLSCFVFLLQHAVSLDGNELETALQLARVCELAENSVQNTAHHPRWLVEFDFAGDDQLQASWLVACDGSSYSLSNTPLKKDNKVNVGSVDCVSPVVTPMKTL